jgi:hypothetical protein
MAELGDFPQDRGARAGQWAHFLGAAVSAALVAGAVLWGYRLAVRDVTGVPVVRAMEGPMRIAPDNPGGEVTAHQGLAVNNVAAEGSAAAPADTLVLAPPPVDLAAEDLAPAEPATPDAGPAAAPVEDQAALVELAVAEALAESATPLSGEIGAQPAVAEGARPEPVLASIRPRSRPAAPADEPAPQPVALREVDPASIPAGTRLVQLGAFDTAEAAVAEWDKLARRFGAVLDGKGRVVMAAQSGGRDFFRLRAEGFADEADARRFCAVLLAENASCVAVTQR